VHLFLYLIKRKPVGSLAKHKPLLNDERVWAEGESLQDPAHGSQQRSPVDMLFLMKWNFKQTQYSLLELKFKTTSEM
jgi:hypothetical protein